MVLGVLLCLFFASLLAAGQADYLSYVEKFADTLLETGRDRYGPKQTPMWAGVIDAQSLTVPQADVPAVPGVRAGDRAIGGCNLYHDAVTLRVFVMLSAVTGRPRYAEAARDYIRAFLANAQHETTGFLAWGEHLYYDLFRDQVAAERRWHELLGSTPPWAELWAVDPRAAARAIAAIRLHYYADDPTTLFNRHAFWDKLEHQRPRGQPWIKHTGLYAYSFAFLHAKTNDPKWLGWSRGTGALYWNRRNPSTNLTLGCIDDPRPSSQHASWGTAELAYWLLKAAHVNPGMADMREHARILLKALDQHFYDPARDAYRTGLKLDGTVLSDATVSVWQFAYGSPTLLPAGRIAAYFARSEKDPAFLVMARRIGGILGKTPPPDNVTVEGAAFALSLALDLYDLTGKKPYLEQARGYADLAIRKFWFPSGDGGLFVRQSNDRYYEAKLATGDLLAGLLRLHLRLTTKQKDPPGFDFTF